MSTNPKEKYPKPGKNEKPQSYPGIEEKMVTKPDYGKESYRGSGRLQGKKALITGGDSGIGRAVAVAFAREGVDVAIAFLPEEEEDACSGAISSVSSSNKSYETWSLYHQHSFNSGI